MKNRLRKVGREKKSILPKNIYTYVKNYMNLYQDKLATLLLKSISNNKPHQLQQ